MTIEKLIKELKQYPKETEVSFSLIEDEHDESQDEKINWIGEIDTSLLESEKPSLVFGFEKETITGSGKPI